MKTTNALKIDASFKPSKRATRHMRAIITPEGAKAILATRNTRNRSLTDSTVEAYARDINAGRWIYNGDAVKFDVDGILTNGQHRLAACVLSGRNLVTDVLTGMPTDSVLREDTGKSRSVSDVISITIGRTETLAVSRLRSVRNVINRRRTRLTVGDFQELRAEFNDGTDLVNRLVTMRSGLGRAPVAAALIIAAESFPNAIEKMITNILTGTVETDAERLLHRYAFLSSTIDPEDTTTKKVLYACAMQVGQVTATKNFKVNSDSLSFFLDTLSKMSAQDAAIPLTTAYLAGLQA